MYCSYLLLVVDCDDWEKYVILLQFCQLNLYDFAGVFFPLLTLRKLKLSKPHDLKENELANCINFRSTLHRI